MTEQFGATPSAHASGPADTARKSSAVRPTELSPAENQQRHQQGAAMNAELAEIQHKLKRLLGKPELNDKQLKSMCALVRKHWLLAGDSPP